MSELPRPESFAEAAKKQEQAIAERTKEDFSNFLAPKLTASGWRGEVKEAFYTKREICQEVLDAFGWEGTWSTKRMGPWEDVPGYLTVGHKYYLEVSPSFKF